MPLKEALLFIVATALAAQSVPRPILGAVVEFKVDSNSTAIGVKPDDGRVVFIKVGLDTEVFRVRPGEPDLKKAEVLKPTDIAYGDRVMISFVEGMTEARRIVVIAATEIAKRNEADRLDWKNRGVFGVVAAKNGNEITLEMRSIQGVRKAIVTVTEKTACRRYASDSVRFTDAKPSSVAEIAIGDQVQARGEKGGDGLNVIAEELVYGTFLTKMGKITVVNLEAKEITIQDLETKQPLNIRLTKDSKLKMLPDARAMFAGTTHERPAGRRGDMTQMLESLPPASIEDLKVGGSIVVSSTRGANSDAVTAIMLLANADFVIQMMHPEHAPGPAGGQGAIDLNAMRAMHGGLLGPGGLSLPAIVP